MKFKYTLNDHYVKYYNEAIGVSILKKKLKKKKTKVRSYISYITFLFVWIFSFLFISSIICFWFDFQILFDLFCSLMVFCFLFYILFFLMFFLGVFKNWNSKEGFLEINSSGISDHLENGMSIEFPYSMIDFVVITKSLLVIVTKTPFLLMINKDHKKQILKEIKKYKDVLVLEDIMKKYNGVCNNEKNSKNNV